MRDTYDMAKYVAPHTRPQTKQQTNKRKTDLVKTAKSYNWIIGKRNGSTTFTKEKPFPSKTLRTTIIQESPRQFRVERAVLKNKKIQSQEITTVRSISGVLKKEYAASIRPRRTYRETL